MTFSSASLSACEVEEVAAIAAAATGLRAGGTAACWRVAGASAGGAWAVGGGAGVAVVAAALVFPCLSRWPWARPRAAVFGTTLRAIGRGFGSGTFGAAQAPVATDHAATNARLVANAVDRNAAVRTDRVTVFPDGESFGLTRSLGLFD